MGEAEYQIRNCTIADGQSIDAASTLILVEYTTSYESQSNDKIIVLNTVFINNSVLVRNGGGIAINIIVYSDHLTSTVTNVLFQNSTFIENQCMQQGSAVSILGDYLRILFLQFYIP